jgi:hypothetical protein
MYAHPKQGRGRSNYNAAQKVYENFTQACGRLGIKVQDPEWVELENETDKAEIEGALLDYMMKGPKSVFRTPKIVVFVNGGDKAYETAKKVFI